MARLEIPEKRDATLYGYVTKSNKLWLEQEARKRGLKISQMLDAFLVKLRNQYSPKKEK